MWLNEYNGKIRQSVAEELRRQYLNNGYNWVSDRTDDIPLVEEDENNGTADITKSTFNFLLILIFVVQFILN